MRVYILIEEEKAEPLPYIPRLPSRSLFRSHLPALLDLDRRRGMGLGGSPLPVTDVLVIQRHRIRCRPSDLVLRPRPFNVCEEVGIVEPPEGRVLCALRPQPGQAAREDVSGVGLLVFGAKGPFEDRGKDGQAGDRDAEERF